MHYYCYLFIFLKKIVDINLSNISSIIHFNSQPIQRELKPNFIEQIKNAVSALSYKNSKNNQFNGSILQVEVKERKLELIKENIPQKFRKIKKEKLMNMSNKQQEAVLTIKNSLNNKEPIVFAASKALFINKYEIQFNFIQILMKVKKKNYQKGCC